MPSLTLEKHRSIAEVLQELKDESDGDD